MRSEPSPSAGSDPRLTAPRGTDEFARVLAFSDGLFAIAMTLLVVGIAVPTVSASGDEGELLSALGDMESSFVSFFVSFVVIGRYWVAHHQYVRLLRGFDDGLIWINLVYLALIAFLPFPTALLGAYFENAVSVAVYAVAVAAVSGMEVVSFSYAHRRGLLQRPIPEPVYRWGLLAATSPVAFFLASVPLAFVSSTLAVLLWFAWVPARPLLERRKPPDADAYLQP